jgi:hypothetical protein
MQITFEHDQNAFQALAGEWDGLLEGSVSRVPFLLHAFQYNWWKTGGGGEWPQRKLWLALGRDPQGELLAIAPFFRPAAPGDEKPLMLIGSVEIADVLDLIGTPEALAEFIPALLEALESEPELKPLSLDLLNLREGTPTRDLLAAAAQGRGWSVENSRLQPSPYVTLGDSWDAYLEQLDSKQSRELKRKLRKAAGYPASVDWRIVNSDAGLAADVDAFLDLMALDPQKSEFLTEDMRKHFHLLAQAAAEQGWLQLVMLDVSGQPAFGYFNFDYDGKLWIYNSGFDPNHARLSPGWVLMGHLIQWAIENKRTEIDFLRGAEEYKYRLGGTDRYVTRLQLTR